MSDGDFMIYNPQQFAVVAEVYLPGQGTQNQLLQAGGQWVISGGVTSGQWVGFFDPETNELLAAALLPDDSTIAQLLLDLGISGLLRMNAQEPLTAENGLDSEVLARVQDVGAAMPQFEKLAARGQHGSSADFPYAEKGQWLGFYDSAENYITGTAAGSFSMVTLTAPRQRFEIGNPYSVGLADVPEGAVRLTVPSSQGTGGSA